MRHGHKNLEPFQNIETIDLIDAKIDCMFIAWEATLQKNLKSFWELFNIEE